MPPERRVTPKNPLWAATERLLTFFRPAPVRRGWRMPTGHAWQPAIAVEALLAAYEVTARDRYLDVVAASFRRYRGRRSRFCDDDGWYLNAWLHAFDVTGEPRYLAEAEALFAAMAEYWDPVCGGGVWWRRDRSYKNAITNELFLLAAARLARRAGTDRAERYLAWAQRAWAWFRDSGMIGSADLVNDGLDAGCRNNGETTWTYNQGVILAGLAELWLATGEPELLEWARRVADGAIRTLVHPDGVLCEPGEAELVSGAAVNRDAHAFKGIFVHGLARLAEAPGSRPAGLERTAFDPAPYRAFIARNADSLVRRAGDGAGGYGLSWVGPPGPVDAATQASACLLLGAAARIGTGGDARGPM